MTDDARARVLAEVLDGAPVADAATRAGVPADVAAGWVRVAVDAGRRSLDGAADAAVGPEDDVEPDPRFSLANERTFLAWNRTALAFIGAGVAVAHLLPDTTLPATRRALALAPILIGALLGWASYGRWAAVQLALRQSRPLPASPLPRLLALAVVAGAVAGGVIAAVAEGS